MPEKKLPPSQRRALGIQEPAPVAPVPDEDGFDAWDLGAAGVRGVSGILSTGGLPGAITSGGGEALAQLLEYLGGDRSVTPGQRLSRIGVEAGIGAVPFAKQVKTGQAIRNFLRAGGLSGAGDVARQVIATGDPSEVNLGQTALATGIGGATGVGAGLLGRLLGIGGKAEPPGPAPFRVEPTDQTKRIPTPKPITPRGAATTSGIPVAEPPAYGPRTAPAASEFDLDEWNRVMGPGVNEGAPTGVPYGGDPTARSRSAARAETAAAREANQAWAQEARNLNAAEKKAAELARAEEIEAARAAAGVEPLPPTFSESLSAPTPGGGRQSMSTRYGVPEEEAPSGFTRVLSETPAPRVPEVPDQFQLPAGPEPVDLPVGGLGDFAPETAPAATGLGSLARFFRNRADALGQENPEAGYYGVRAARQRGENIPVELERGLGRDLRQAAVAQGQPVGASAGAPAPPLDINSPAYAAQAAEEAAAAGRPLGEAADAEQVSLLRRFLSERGAGGELGAASPEVITQLFTTLIGGATGAALDPLGNPLLSGAAGAGLGFGLPMAAGRSVSALRDVGGNMREAFGDRESLADTVLSVAEKIPNTIRFNQLTDPLGLAANAYAGPYGSAAMGGLEELLKGNPQGLEVLRNLNPVKFGRDIVGNWQEATELIQRGELGREGAVGMGNTVYDAAMTTPGRAMTAGDVTARNVLQKAGIPENVARSMTLTSEPWSPLRSLAHFGSGSGDDSLGSRAVSVLSNILLPYKRTPVNIFEQGMERAPVVGAVGKALAGADPREILAQQAISVPGSAAAYYAGQEAEDISPTTGRNVGRFVSNLGGRYSLPFSAAYNIGRGVSKGQSPLQISNRLIEDTLPVPTVDFLQDLGKLAIKGDVPRAIIPGGTAGYDVFVESPRAVEPRYRPRRTPPSRRAPREQ